MARRSSSTSMRPSRNRRYSRSEEHTSELQSHSDLVCRLLLEKKKKQHQFDKLLAVVGVALLVKRPAEVASLLQSTSSMTGHRSYAVPLSEFAPVQPDGTIRQL